MPCLLKHIHQTAHSFLGSPREEDKQTLGTARAPSAYITVQAFFSTALHLQKARSLLSRVVDVLPRLVSLVGSPLNAAEEGSALRTSVCGSSIVMWHYSTAALVQFCGKLGRCFCRASTEITAAIYAVVTKPSHLPRLN